MATNFVQEGDILTLTAPATVASGAPIAVGLFVGVVQKDAASGANMEVDTGGVYDLSVKGVNDAGNVAIAAGDAIYYNSADTPVLSAKASGTPFGIAKAAVSSGATATINVKICGGSGVAGSGSITQILPADQQLLIRNETGGNLVAGDLVYVSGWSEAQSRWLVTKADADAAGRRATLVMTVTLATATNGAAYKTYRTAATQNTNGASVGDPVYLDTTAGGWTLTKPSGAAAIVQIVGRVAVVSATVGVVEFDLLSLNQEAVGTNELQSKAVTTDKMAQDVARRFTVYNNTGGQINVDQLLHIKSWNVANSAWDVEPADADAAKPAHLVANANIANAAAGEARDLKASAATQNTNGRTVGDAVYLDATTAGGYTFTAPTAANAFQQIVGRVKVVSATIGEIEFNLGAVQAPYKIGEDQFQRAAGRGTIVADVADANVIGGIPLIFRIDIADAATGDVDVVSTHKIRVIDAWAVKTVGAGGAVNTVQVKNGANAITDAMSININDQAIARAGSIDDAQHEIAAAGTLRVTRTKAGGNAACIVYVKAIRVV